MPAFSQEISYYKARKKIIQKVHEKESSVPINWDLFKKDNFSEIKIKCFLCRKQSITIEIMKKCLFLNENIINQSLHEQWILNFYLFGKKEGENITKYPKLSV